MIIIFYLFMSLFEHVEPIYFASYDMTFSNPTLVITPNIAHRVIHRTHRETPASTCLIRHQSFARPPVPHVHHFLDMT